jgi:hypothetical protein
VSHDQDLPVLFFFDVVYGRLDAGAVVEELAGGVEVS